MKFRAAMFGKSQATNTSRNFFERLLLLVVKLSQYDSWLPRCCLQWIRDQLLFATAMCNLIPGSVGIGTNEPSSNWNSICQWVFTITWNVLGIKLSRNLRPQITGYSFPVHHKCHIVYVIPSQFPFLSRKCVFGRVNLFFIVVGSNK